VKAFVAMIFVVVSIAKSQDLNSRLVIVGSGLAASYATVYFVLLKDGWWDKMEPFHYEPFHIDMNYATNLDKFGHFYSGAVIGELLTMSYDWAGLNPFASTLWAGITVGVTQIVIEFKDGFSRYGYSVFDATAGTLGGFYAMGKRFIPAMQYVDFKFTYWPNSSEYWDVHKRKNKTGIWFDDYYGGNQTYWLSFKVAKMLPSKARDYYPEWLAFAFGLGLQDVFVDRDPGWDEIRLGYYISLDYDFEAIFHPQKTWSKNLITVLNHIKFPAPTVRLHPDAKFYPFHPWYGFYVSF